ncbi:HAD-like domain-containing protein [Tuber indicum]|nr:HAD-like domain-containing protein [Tuber indicum]
MPPKAILIDIEGTICPITFVKETLFPYALAALPGYLSKNWTTTNPLIAAFPAANTTTPAALINYVQAQTIQDSKSPALKALQGHLWRAGYESGELVAPIYPDVLPAVRAWRSQTPRAVRVYVYSSGSVRAQELFFHYSCEGDVRGLFDGFFDTGVGAKVEAESYRKILRECEEGGEGEGWVFLSDHVGEVRAAMEAGMMGGVVVREGNAPLSEEDKVGMWVIGGGFTEVTEKLFAE